MGVDYKEFLELEKRLKNANKDINVFIETCAKELTARVLAKVVERTPVGIYQSSTGKSGGTLRRGWSAGDSIRGFRSGNRYIVLIKNSVFYASYVEHGHRTRGGGGWVEGKLMLTLSIEDIDRNASAIIEKKLQKILGDMFK